MKDKPKRQKILVGILVVLMLVVAFMQLSGGGGGDESGSTPAAPSNAVKPRATTGGSGSAASGSGSSSGSMPADPTQAQRPQSMEITQPGNFPGTEPPVITYNPYIQPTNAAG